MYRKQKFVLNIKILHKLFLDLSHSKYDNLLNNLKMAFGEKLARFINLVILWLNLQMTRSFRKIRHVLGSVIPFCYKYLFFYCKRRHFYKYHVRGYRQIQKRFKKKNNLILYLVSLQLCHTDFVYFRIWFPITSNSVQLILFRYIFLFFSFEL